MHPSNWSELPSHLQVLFMKKLVSIKDYIRFGAVCRSWRSVFRHYLDHKQLLPQLPFLMIHSLFPFIDTKDATVQIWKLYCLSVRRVVHELEINLPYRYCRGSRHGWLVLMANDSNYSVRLYNPFLSVNNMIQLPPLKPLEEDNINTLWKAFPSKNPTTSNPKDYVVIGILVVEGRIVFCKPGDKAWSILPSQWKYFADVAYYKGLFYAVRSEGEVIAIDLSVTDDSTQQHQVAPKVKRVAPRPPSDIVGCIGKYIVESFGDLLQVQRFQNRECNDDDHDVTNNIFRVFKLLFNPDEEEQEHEHNGKDSKWVEVKTLDGNALFVGDNASISLSASDFPACKPNCIYFTDEPEDIGIFNLEDGTVEQLICPTRITCWVPPIWVEPSLQQ